MPRTLCKMAHIFDKNYMKPCFWQILIGYKLLNGISLWLSIFFTVSTFSNLNFSVSNCLSLFSHLFSQFYQFGLMDIIFIWGVVIHYYHHFVGEIFPAVSWFLCPFNMSASFFFCFEHLFLILQDALCLSCIFPAPTPEPAISPRRVASCIVE